MTIGQYLKQKRLEKDIALRFASDKTKIHQRLLENLEENNFANLPNLIYLKGFLSQLSKILDLDKEYAISLLEVNYQSYLDHANLLPTPTSRRSDVKHLNELMDIFSALNFLFTWKNITLITSSGLFLFAFFFIRTELTKSDFTDNKHYDAIMANKLFNNMVNESSISPVKKTPYSIPVVSRKILIKGINNDSWISYQVDKLPVRKLTLLKSKELFVEGNQIRLVIGRPEAIQIISDGQELELKPFIASSGAAVVNLPIKQMEAITIK